jgi:hypothetical protein
MNSVEADAARTKRIADRHQTSHAGNRDIPSNCYTQTDLDVYANANGYHEIPNPQWLDRDAPIHGCVPGSLIPPDVEDKRAFVNRQTAWISMNCSPADKTPLHRKDAFVTRGASIICRWFLFFQTRVKRTLL